MQLAQVNHFRQPSAGSNVFSRRAAIQSLGLIAALHLVGEIRAQPVIALHVSPIKSVRAKAGTTVEAAVSVQLLPGYHVNSNTPDDPFLIPLRLTWQAGTLESPEVIFPQARAEKYSFSEKPLSVFTKDFEIVTRFKISARATPGSQVISGKLRFQACDERSCLAPRTIDVELPVEIVK